MKSFKNLPNYPTSLMLAADDIVEFHAARILLLVRICGTKQLHVDGLTKLAKLDFFVRYPEFFSRVAGAQSPNDTGMSSVESPMIRYFYGPWDKRYYHVLSYLEARQLLQISKPTAKTFRFSLTEEGILVASKLASDDSFAELTAHMKSVAATLGKRSGTALKEMVYRAFEEEVAQKKFGEVI